MINNKIVVIGLGLFSLLSIAQSDNRLLLKSGSFDPVAERGWETDRELDDSGSDETMLYIVQYNQPIQNDFVAELKKLGIEVHQYIPNQAHVVRAKSSAIANARKLEFVRWAGRYKNNLKFNAELKNQFVSDSVDYEVQRFNIVLVDKADRIALKDKIQKLGGKVLGLNDGSVLIEADLTSPQFESVSDLPEVLWMDHSTPIEVDVDNARIQGGANFLGDLKLNIPNAFTGVGIRGHVMEGIDPKHPEFAETEFRKIPIAIETSTADSHGHQTFGIVFGGGLKNKKARGLLPNAQGYFTNYNYVYNTPPGNKEVKSRFRLVEKMIEENQIMFQTASWGYQTTKQYDSRSLEMDDLIFNLDIPITQSQSNTGTQMSRPQAWSKNIISVGALYHFDNANPEDDKWNKGGSIGPSADGRIKPDIAAYYDKIFTTTLNNGYTEGFGGTSGATPIIAGHVGLIIEMWTEGIFSNKLEFPKSERFKNRPHFATVKALLLNSAKQYPFTGEADDRTRVHQGWGFPDLAMLYERRDNILIVNQTDIIKAKETKKYEVVIGPDAPEFKTTLVFPDPPGAPSASVARVNDLNLKVTDPKGTVYWGNNGLLAGNYSTPGGKPNSVDTVENVFIETPMQGKWLVEVIAEEINQDGHLATRDVLDADYALVISGIQTE